MICPHCRASLLGKERTGGVCSRCGRAFALDPKVNGRGMHDARIRRVARSATDGGRRRVTLTQLGYLARTANTSWTAVPPRGRPQWIARFVGVVLVIGLVVLAAFVHRLALGGLIWFAGACAAALLYAVAKGDPYLPGHPAGSSLTPEPGSFRAMMCGRWVEVYGSLPPGIVDDRQYRETPAGTDRDTGGGPAAEAVELLCPDRAVRVFVEINGLADGLDLALAAGLEDLSATGPVVVLHDASARGLQLVADVRANHPGRVVVDAGLPVRAVLGNDKAVRLYKEPPADVRWGEADWLRELTRVAAAEAAWLAKGWESPLAAVPPALLESAIVRAVQEARSTTARERRDAAEVGFMSWPQPAEPAPNDGS